MKSLFCVLYLFLQILGGGISSSQPASQLSQTLSHSSQIQVDVHVRGGGVGNEALCLEILGKLNMLKSLLSQNRRTVETVNIFL